MEELVFKKNNIVNKILFTLLTFILFSIYFFSFFLQDEIDFNFINVKANTTTECQKNGFCVGATQNSIARNNETCDLVNSTNIRIRCLNGKWVMENRNEDNLCSESSPIAICRNKKVNYDFNPNFPNQVVGVGTQQLPPPRPCKCVLRESTTDNSCRCIESEDSIRTDINTKDFFLCIPKSYRSTPGGFSGCALNRVLFDIVQSNYTHCSGDKFLCILPIFTLKDAVNLRSGPGTSFSRIQVAQKNTKITVLIDKNTDQIDGKTYNIPYIEKDHIWIRVRVGEGANAKIGYMSITAIADLITPPPNSSGRSGSGGGSGGGGGSTPAPQTGGDNNSGSGSSSGSGNSGGGVGNVGNTPNEPIVNRVRPTFNAITKNGCGQECSWSRGLCQEGFTCRFYNSDCYAPDFGLPVTEAVCVPNNSSRITLSPCDPTDPNPNQNYKFVKSDGSSWTPTVENILYLCRDNSIGDGGGNPGISATPTINSQPTQNNNIKGYVDKIDCDFVQGWACDTNIVNQAVEVELYVDNLPERGGRLVGKALANIEREDAVGSLCGNIKFRGYSIPIPNSIRQKGNKNFFVVVRNSLNNVRVPLLNSTTSLNSTSFDTNKCEIKNTDICGPVDINGDNKINIVDFAHFARVYNTYCGRSQSTNIIKPVVD